MLNKRDGGEWALWNLSSDYQRVIQAALNAYSTGLGMFYDKGEAEDFCSMALDQLGIER